MKKSLLIVDDDACLLEMVADVFPLGQFEVTTCLDGTSAMQAFQSGHFDLIITDLRMPGMSGIQLIQAIRSLPTSPHAVLISASLDDFKQEITALDDVSTFSKPFSPKDLLNHVGTLLR
jgi:two-component system response regulator MtrA